MQVSPKNITFSDTQLKQLVKIQNPSQDKHIYKLKINQPQAFTIYPARGFIEPEKTISIQITLKKPTQTTAKLMVVSAPIVNLQSEAFDKTWNSIQKTNFKNYFIQINCAKMTNIETKTQVKTIRMTESLVQENQLSNSIHFKSQKSQQSFLNKKQPINQVNQSHKTNPNMLRTLKDLSKRSKTISMQASKSQKSSAIQEELQKEKQKNKVLKQKLSERDKKLMYFEQKEQKKINNSFNSEQSGFKLNNLNICLLAIVCILIGFFIANKEVVSADAL